MSAGCGSRQEIGQGTMEINDDVLMTRFQSGDESAFRRLLERYQDRIVNYVMRMVGDRDTALDLAQDVFLRVYVNAGQYRPGSKFAPWLYRIASNLAINEIRRRKRWRFLTIDVRNRDDEDTGILELPDEKGVTPEEHVSQQESAERIEKALAKLPVKYRSPLILRELEGYDYEEIGTILNIPRGTVKSRLNRGRALLKTALYRLEAASKVVSQ